MANDKYMVGSSQSKDKYTVGQSGKDKYYVGGGGKSPGQASNKDLSGGDQDGVVGSKSSFKYPYDTSSAYKDVGDKSDNSNFGGGKVMGIKNDGATGPAGEIPLVYSEKGDFDSKKDAMARRAAMSANAKDYSGDKLDVPSGFIWKDKVP